MSKGYLIDAEHRTVTELPECDFATMRQHLPGGLDIGTVLENGDVIYVDEEGLLHPVKAAFRLLARDDGQPMMSNGIVTGRDDGDDTLAPESSIAEIEREIEWLDLPRALAWFKGNASEPAVVIHNESARCLIFCQLLVDFVIHMPYRLPMTSDVT